VDRRLGGVRIDVDPGAGAPRSEPLLWAIRESRVPRSAKFAVI